MNNKQVAHLWANQSRESANGSHFYFSGDTIYSYGGHFPVARHYKGVVLFTSKSYSSTTACHKSIARGACGHLPVFTVSDVMAKPSAKDVKEYAEQIADILKSAARARDPQYHIESAQRAITEANDFCTRFGFKRRFAMPEGNFLAELQEKSMKEQARKAKATVERNAKIEAYNAETIRFWLAGDAVTVPWSVQTVYLRAKGDTMQTSRGAIVPLVDAHKAFRFVMAKRATGWHRNGEQFPVGDFQLDAVNEFGVIAGCHRVAWTEIERFAAVMGWNS